MSNFDKIELKLTLMCMTVFTAILIIFAASVLSSFTNQVKEDTRADLRLLTDGVVASIDFDEDKERHPSSAEPDSIVSELPDTASQLLNDMKLEWFDFQSKLTAEKGSFKVSAPLVKEEGFTTLTNPRGLMYTKPVLDNGHLLGYVRVAEPLDKEDRTINNLKTGFLFGTLAALLLSGLGTALIVRQSMQPIIKMMQQLRQFTADASHELRNPITAIRTNSAVALKHPEGMRSSDQEKFKLIEQSGQQMQRLVEALLLLSHAEQVPRPASKANLQEVAKKSVASLQSLSEKKNTKIDLEIAPEIDVDCDPDDVQRMLSNIVENAIRYTPANGTVRIQAMREGGQTTVQVEDNGIGISSDDQEKIYNRFFRVDKARNYEDGNQGLGLAIVKALAERYQGSISVRSELGKGSTFSLSLPSSTNSVGVKDPNA